MKFKRLAVLLAVLVALAPTALAQRPRDLRVEIYVPSGMPIEVQVVRDENEPTITKYNIKRLVASDVKSVTITEVVYEQGDSPGEFKIVAHHGFRRYTADRVADPASVAWASSVKLAKFVLIVERLETDTGVWVFDVPDPKAAVQEVLKRGSEALPPAKYVPK